MERNAKEIAFREHVMGCAECQQRLAGVTSVTRVCEIAKEHGFDLDPRTTRELLRKQAQEPTAHNTEKKNDTSIAPLHCFICSGYKLWSCGFVCEGNIVSPEGEGDEE